MPISPQSLQLSFGFTFADLYVREGLVRLDCAFAEQLRATDAGLHDRLMSARANLSGLTSKQQSELIIDLAPHLEDFLGELFGIQAEIRELQAQHNESAPLHAVKRKFVFKRALTGMTKERAESIDGPAVALKLEAAMGQALTEQSYAEHVSRWLEAESQWGNELALAAQYAAWAALSDAGKAKHKSGIVFRMPHKLDMQHLVAVELVQIGGVSRYVLPEHDWRHREGFELTDHGMDLTHALDQAHYCIKCHNQGKDSCSTGLQREERAISRRACSV